MITQDDIEAFAKPKILVIGHGRHGKDSAAEILHRKYGFKFVSSSEFVAQEIIWDQWGWLKYPDFDAMFADRHNHRRAWMEMIADYNTPWKDRTARTMFDRGYDIYVGLRRQDELDASRHLFDCIIWVDRSEHLPPETGSMDITRDSAEPDFVIDNNGTLDDLERSVDFVATQIL